jgi:3-hydroxymyristoyl/3-hydroxydecanoyl-(acyl carrier protein) dehydratase
MSSQAMTSPGATAVEAAATRDHFAAFSFVDRIADWTPGRSARGAFAIPADLPGFSSCLVSEAVGQLAAWVSMDHIDFRGRPVAALATETRFLGEAVPGKTLELAVDIDHCDDETVAYGGHASIDGNRIIELADCLGPMLPVAEFDDPAALREWLAVLRGPGATPHRFHGIALPRTTETASTPGSSLRATLPVPTRAPFFNDHFPRRAVFPATLLLDVMTRLVHGVAGQAAWAEGRHVAFSRVTHVKMRAFIEPGQTIEIAIDLAPPVDGVAKAMLKASIGERTLASARLELDVA